MPELDIPRWRLVIPRAAVVALVYMLYRIPHPTGAAARLPAATAVWLAIPVVTVWVFPRVVGRTGADLMASVAPEGTSADCAVRTERDGSSEGVGDDGGSRVGV